MVFRTADFLTRFLDSRSSLFKGSARVRRYAQQMNIFSDSAKWMNYDLFQVRPKIANLAKHNDGMLKGKLGPWRIQGVVGGAIN